MASGYNRVMDVLRTVLLGVQVLSAVLIMVLVLLHSPKGDGLSALSSMGTIFSSQKGAEATLNKATGWMVGIFFVVSFVLGYYLS